MSDLYKEAIAEAKKVREIAELDARNAIMEKISPYIKKMIAKEASDATSFFFEEDELPLVDDGTEETVEDAPSLPGEDGMPQTVDTASVPPADTSAMGGTDVPAALPIAPSGADVMNMALPDEEGKITIDFDQLFAAPGAGDTVTPVDTAEMAPGEPLPGTTGEEVPPPVAAGANDMVGEPAEIPPPPPVESDETIPSPEEEEEMAKGTPPVVAENLTNFKLAMSEVAMKINAAYHSGKISDITQEALKTRLFSLLEQLDSLNESGRISSKQSKLNEKRLEFLFLQLKEASLHNSYMTEKDMDTSMSTSLKEFAAKLFESEDQESLAQDSASTGKTGMKTRPDMTAHAKEESGISPEVDDLFKEEHDAMAGGETTDTSGAGRAGSVKAKALPNADGGKSQDKPWEDGEPETVSEEVEAEGHAGFGDASEKPVAAPDMFFEIDEQELREAVAAVRKEVADKKAWEKGKPVGKKTKGVPVSESVSEMGMEEDLVLNVELPDEIEDELDVDDLDVGLELTGAEEEEDLGDEEGLELGDEEEEGEEGLELGDEEEEDFGADEEGEEGLELGDEEESDVGSGMDLGSEEEEMVLSDEEEEPAGRPGMDEMFMEAKRAALRMRKSLVESRKKGAKLLKIAESKNKEVKTLKREMAETNLFLSKLVYLNKFLQREDLSRKVKQQIVEHLDRAKTVAEAKEIYAKIKTRLDEGTVAATRSSASAVGSASKPTTAGSASPARLNESVGSNSDGSSGNDPVIGTFERWQKLARVTKNEE